MSAAEEQLFQRFGREFAAGEVLFREGDPGREMFVVHSGLVEITKRVRDLDKLLGRLGPGEFFGEMALLNNKPRNATATVVEDAKLVVVDPRTFEAMLKGNSEIAGRLVRKLAARLEDSNEQIENLMLRDPASRVAHLLCRQVAKVLAPGETGATVAVQPRELPARLGLRQEQVDDVLARLQRARLATVQPDGVQVPDVARLQEYLKFLEMKERFGDL